MKKLQHPKVINDNLIDFIQDCDRWIHPLASILPERPKGTFFFNLVAVTVLANDEELEKMNQNIKTEASISWQNLCELWAAIILVGAILYNEVGKVPSWFEMLADWAIDKLNTDWKADKPQWKFFVNGFILRIED